jgi:hypothetical protein
LGTFISIEERDNILSFSGILNKKMPDYGCNLDEAFQDKSEEAPASSQMNKSKKKKKSSAIPPPQEYIDFTQIGGDPDRQQYVRPKLVDAMQKSKPSWFGSTDSVEASPFMQAMNKSQNVTESYADFNPGVNSSNEYHLGNDINADFTTAFSQRGVQKASAIPAYPPISDVWKPLTPSGADTAFFNYLPKSQPTENIVSSVNQDSLHRRLKSIYDRLDLLETSKRENAETEVVLFVLSGVFFLFSLDLVTKLSR